jgi:hypothetical protein
MLAERIVKVSLESGVLCRFTAYVAVDRSEVVNEGGRQHTIIQPVEQPAGWAGGGMMRGTVACYAAAPMALMRKRSGGITGGFGTVAREMLAAPRAMSGFALSDTDDLDGAPDTWRTTIVNQLLGMLRGGRRKSLDWTKLESSLLEIRSAVERLRKATSPVREDFADLVAALLALSDVLAKAKHAAKDQAKQLADEGGAIVVAWPVAPTRLAGYLNQVAQTLESLADPAQRKRSQAFWK